MKMAFTDTLDAKGKEQGWQGSPSFLWVGRDEEEMWIWRRGPPSAPESHLTPPCTGARYQVPRVSSDWLGTIEEEKGEWPVVGWGDKGPRESALDFVIYMFVVGGQTSY